jgi:hypothetical protein
MTLFTASCCSASSSWLHVLFLLPWGRWMTEREIDPHEAIDFLYRSGRKYAEAKAHRVYMDEYRKSLKAILMKKSGESSAAAQEREAYSHPDYLAHLKGQEAAIIEEESLRWGLVAAEARIDVWRSQEASNRRMDRATQ